MEQALDTLAASRKLEDSGMPERQADAVVEVVNDAMKNLVTKEYLTAELDRRLGAVDKQFGAMDNRITNLETKMDAKMEVGFASVREDMHRSQKALIGLMLASTLAVIAMQLAVLAILY